MNSPLSYETDDQQDKRLSPYELSQREANVGNETAKQARLNREFDDATNPQNFSKNADVGRENSNIKKAARQEDNPMGYIGPSTLGQKSKLNSIIKLASKSKAGASLIGIIVAVLVGLGSFLPSALIPLHVLEVFVNHNDSDGRASRVYYNKIMAYRLSSKAESACSKKPTSRACKSGSIGPEEQERFRDNKFKLKGTVVGDRLIVREITTPPDSKGRTYKVTSGAELQKRARKSPSINSKLMAATNPQVSSHGKNFRSAIARYGASFKRVKVTGDTQKEKAASFRSEAGIKTGEALADDFKNTKATSIGTRVSSKSVNAAAAGCLTYNAARLTLASAKIYNAQEYMKFFIAFGVTATEIKTSGIDDEESLEPEKMEFLGDMLTSTALSGPMKGLAATDSPGYKAAAHGDRGRLEKFASNMLLGGNPSLITLDETVNYFENKLDKDNIRAACRQANDPLVAGALIAAQCGTEAAAGAAVGSIIPGAGTAAGGGSKAAWCLAKNVAKIFVAAWVVNKAVDKAIDVALKALTSSKITSDLVGPENGDALAIGANVVYNFKASQSGMFAGDKASVNEFMAATDESHSQYIAALRHQAAATPFDATNQHSFLGSLVRKSGVIGAKLSPTSTMALLSNSLFSTASAANTPYASTSAYTTEYCTSKEQRKMGLVCDRVGNTRPVVSSQALDLPPEEVYDYMESNNQADPISGDGEAIGGSDYAKWVKYCAEREPSPMGETDAFIEDDDYYWANGANCAHTTNNLDGDNNITNEQRTYFEAYRGLSTTAANTDESFETQSIDQTSGAENIKVATYNILNINYRNGNVEPTKRGAKRMKEEGVTILATQETRPEAFSAIKQTLGTGYSGFMPKSGSGRAIFWDSTTFKLKRSGSYNAPKDGVMKPMPWVELESNGKSLYFFNLHTQSGPKATDKQDRTRSANIAMSQIKRITGSSDAPVILAGDMNSNYTKKSNRSEVYDVVKKSMDLTYNKASKRINADCETIRPLGKKQCGRDEPASHNDHIYVSRGDDITVNTWETIVDQSVLGISDHTPVLSDLTIPGFAEDSTEAGGKIVGDDYKQECGKYLSSGDCTGQCVGFVKFRLVKHGVIKSQSLGNGRYVTSTLRGLGFEVNKTPAVNSVFSLKHNSVGHTGMVSKVNSDGSIVVEEYNWTKPVAYGTRTITKATLDRLTAANQIDFAHTETKYR